MDIVIKKISKKYLEENIIYFVKILNNEMYEYWQYEHFLLELPMKFEFSLMALLNKQLVGYIIASKKEERSYIHKFIIDREYRGMGVGSLLQNEFETSIAIKDIKKISLSVYAENIKGISFYLKNGYYIFDSRTDKFGNKVLVMTKDLSL
jgi:ribosomal protein S18 acetylase RimI-like enzyme